MLLVLQKKSPLEEFFTLDLPVSNEGTLEDCFNTYFQDEVLDEV